MSGETLTKSISEQVRELIDSGAVEPTPLDDVAVKLVDLLEDEERADAQSVSLLLQRDPALAAAVIKVANSAAYGGLTTITQLDKAVSRLGLKQVRSVVTALSMKKLFQSDDTKEKEILKALWAHSMATAAAAKKLANLTGVDTEASFLAGLLHDVGQLLVLSGLHELKRQNPQLEVTDVVFQELLDSEHAQLGCDVLLGWNFPEMIAEAVRNHHNSEAMDKGELTLCIQAANIIAGRVAQSPDAQPERDLMAFAPVVALDLTEVELATLIVDLEDDIAILTSQFGG